MKSLIILGILVLLSSCTYSQGIIQQSENTYLIGARGEGKNHVKTKVRKMAEEKCPDYKIVSVSERLIVGLTHWRVYWTIECPENN